MRSACSIEPRARGARCTPSTAARLLICLPWRWAIGRLESWCPMENDWTPRECVHLLLLAGRMRADYAIPQRLMDSLRRRLLAQECRSASPYMHRPGLDHE